MTIDLITKKRGIAELVHFSTSTGLLGILSTQNLLPRSALAQEQSLEFILKYNSPYRSDPSWLKYVNLSISRINHQFFAHSGSLHTNSGLFWVVIGIDIEIMLHEGVYFTTTNNIYPACRRGTGHVALEQLFLPKVFGRYGVEIHRPVDHPDHWTTCPQAEVLYPGPLPARFIRNIYVRTDNDLNAVHAQIAALGVGPYTVTVAPDKFINTGVRP